MSRNCQITIDGRSFSARRGALLLDAALSAGIDVPYSCRAGHCGTCCVRLIRGEVQGGQGSQPGIIHACQCRVSGDVVIERIERHSARTVEGALTSLRMLSADVVEVGITAGSALPYHAGQYAEVSFNNFPSRPFSITHPLSGNAHRSAIFFHIRRMKPGRVTAALGTHIKIGHKVKISGPYGSAHFRPDMPGRLILVATNTGFAPIWSIAVAALRENPQRRMMIIAGGRTIESLYMAPALSRLAGFPNVLVVPISSTPQALTKAVLPGRPTDYLPRFHPGDVVYVCGAPGMVADVKAITAQAGVICYADPFMPATDDGAAGSFPPAARKWLAPAQRAVPQLCGPALST